MFGFISKLVLFALGQRLIKANLEGRKRSYTRMIFLAIASLMLFAQGMAALLFAAYFGLVGTGLADYYAALIVSGIAFVLSLSIALILRRILCKTKEAEKRKLSGIISGLADLDPGGLIAAFIDGFTRTRRGESANYEPYSAEKLRHKSR